MSTLFLSHSTADKAVAERWRDHLFTIGFNDVFIDNHSILPGQRWEPVLYQRLRSCRAVIALISSNFNASKWCFAEITHARALGRPILPVLLDRSSLPEFLNDIQSQSVEGAMADVLDRVRRGLESLGVRSDDSLAWDSRRPPYPGLLAFDAADAGVYFGREQDVRTVLDRAYDLSNFGKPPRVLVILGASGTGKSSLLRAGVLPRMALYPSRWFLASPIRPSQQPLSKLADCFAAALSNSPHFQTLSEILLQLNSPSAGHNILDALAGEDRQRTIVIAVDQIEELGSSTNDECSQLQEWLKRILQMEQHRILILGTLRSDLLTRVESVAPWVPQARLVPLASLSESDLLRTVLEPARVAGLEIEQELAQNLLADVRERQALPLLAFALRELWERRSPNGKLRNSTYIEDLGRINGAVRRAAETATASLAQDKADTEALRLALLELVQISPDGQTSKRSAKRLQLPPRSALSIDALISARLLVADGDSIEPAHESLFAAWEQLASWVEDARSALMVRAESQIDSELWVRALKDPEYLWGAARLERAVSLIQTSGIALSPGAQSFLQASKDAVELRRKNEEKLRNQEISRLRKQRRTVASVAAIALFAAAIAFVFFLRARQAQIQIANSLRDSLLQAARAACSDVAVGSRDIGLEALRKAAQLSPGEDLRSAYVNCLEHPSLRDLTADQKLRITTGQPPETRLVHMDGGVKATLLPAGADDTFEVQTESNGKLLAKWRLTANSVDSIRVSPQGTLVAIVDYDFAFQHQTLDLFDAHSGNHVSSLPAQDSSLGHMFPTPHRISFDPSGRYVALAGIGGSVFAWDLQSYRNPTPSLRTRPFAAETLSTAISPDGRWVAAVDENANVAVLEMETNQVVARTSVASRLIESAPGGIKLELEWSNNDRVKLGTLQWQWLGPVDQGFWATGNINNQRAIRDLVFDASGTRVAVGTEYGGRPYIATLSGSRPDVSHPRLGSEFPNSIGKVVFDEESSICAAELSRIFCLDLHSGTRQEVSADDFRRWNNQLTYEQGQLIVAGERHSTLIRMYDTNGSKIWERKFDQESLSAPQILIDTPSRGIAYRGLDTLTSFNMVRLQDGGLDGSFRLDDPNDRVQMVLLNGSFALLNSIDLSFRRFSDGAILREPMERASPDPPQFTLRTSDSLVAGRTRNGATTVWDFQTRKKCSIATVPPRNKADALNVIAKRYAAFDGDFLKIWNTTNCKLVAVIGNVDADDLAMTPDGTKLLYRTSQNKLITQDLRTQRKTEMTFDPIEKCFIRAGSGWNDSRTAFWDSCLTSVGTVVVRAWNVGNGTRIFDLTVPRVGNSVSVALADDLKRVVVAWGVSEAGIWTWSLRPTPKDVSEPCKSALMAADWRGLWVVDHGQKAAWVDAPEKDHVALNTMDLSSCEMRSAKLTSLIKIAGGTPSSAVLAISEDSVQAIAPDGKIQWRAFDGFKQITHAAVSADGKWIGASLDHGTVLFSRIGEAQPRLRLHGGPGDITTLNIAPDGSWCAAGTAEGRVNIWAIKQMDADLAGAGLGPSSNR